MRDREGIKKSTKNMNFLNLRWSSELSKLAIVPHVSPGIHVSPGVHVPLERKHWGIMTSLESSDLQRKMQKIMFLDF